MFFLNSIFLVSKKHAQRLMLTLANETQTWHRKAQAFVITH